MVESLGRIYFPGSGFEWDMEVKSIHDFIKVSSAIANTMVFMDHPHIILKAVPFIILESFAWDPQYGASLLVADNYTDKSNWYESTLINFFKFFAGIEGRRVKGFCNDPDIQFHSFVKDKELLLVMNNMSTIDEPLEFDIPDLNNVSEITIRRFGRQKDFRPYFIEETISSLDSITILGRESMVLSLQYNKKVQPEKAMNEIPYYGDKVSHYISNSESFIIEIDNTDSIDYAFLRLSLDRPRGSDYDVRVDLNGTELLIPIEDAAERFEDSDSYASLKIIKIDPSLLQAKNTVTASWKDGRRGGIGSAIIRTGVVTEEFDVTQGDADDKFSAYPNPFKEEMTIDIFKIGASGNTTVKIYDTRGRLTKKVNLQDGYSSVVWEGTNAQGKPCASGIYFVQVKGDGFSEVQRVTFVK